MRVCRSFLTCILTSLKIVGLSIKQHFIYAHLTLTFYSIRYRESTASFAALATQSSLLSQSDSALYDKDHPAMGGKGKQTFVFHETRPDVLVSMRERLGLKEWITKSADGETTSP